MLIFFKAALVLTVDSYVLRMCIACLGLPSSGSWQDLKDHMREAGDVCYADVSKDGRGVVEFLHYDDMKYAVKKLDNSKFRSHEVCSHFIYKFFVSCCTVVIRIFS